MNAAVSLVVAFGALFVTPSADHGGQFFFQDLP
jgi:hypothetical protein